MSKLVYEKPEMLVEAFVPTQSVAATCGEQIQKVLYLSDNELVCDGDGGKQDNGHKFTFDNLMKQSAKMGISEATVKNWQKDGELSVFSGKVAGCELMFDEHVNGDVVELGKLLTGTGSFNAGNNHKVAIDGVVIGS